MPEYPNPKLPSAGLVDPPAEVARCPSGVEYAELDVTTNFSFLRGASHPDELVFTSAMLGQKAMAVTDVDPSGRILVAGRRDDVAIESGRHGSARSVCFLHGGV